MLAGAVHHPEKKSKPLKDNVEGFQWSFVTLNMGVLVFSPSEAWSFPSYPKFLSGCRMGHFSSQYRVPCVNSNCNWGCNFVKWDTALYGLLTFEIYANHSLGTSSSVHGQGWYMTIAFANCGWRHLFMSFGLCITVLGIKAASWMVEAIVLDNNYSICHWREWMSPATGSWSCKEDSKDDWRCAGYVIGASG